MLYIWSYVLKGLKIYQLPSTSRYIKLKIQSKQPQEVIKVTPKQQEKSPQ